MSPGAAFVNMTEIYKASSKQTNDFLDQPLWNGSSLIGLSYEGGIFSNLVKESVCPASLETGIGDSRGCREADLKVVSQPNVGWYVTPSDNYFKESRYKIDYCLIEEKFPQHYTFEFIPAVMAIVVCCNLVKLLVLVETLRYLGRQRESIFATVGDAAASFLDRPDQRTRDSCLIGRPNITAVTFWALGENHVKCPMPWGPQTKRSLFFATSKTRWFLSMSLCCLYLLVGTFLLVKGVETAELTPLSLSQVWGLGFGTPNADSVIKISGQSFTRLLQDIMMANSFQVALSPTYFLYNSLFTAQCCAIEWAQFATKRQPLRVTFPAGEQRSSWTLQLPWKYGLLLSTALAVLHFLISQSVFIIRVQWYDIHNTKDPSCYLSNVGYSPLAILCSVCLGAAMVLAQILHTLRPLNSEIPIHGNLSGIISAACRPQHRRHHETFNSKHSPGGALILHPSADSRQPRETGSFASSRTQLLSAAPLIAPSTFPSTAEPLPPLPRSQSPLSSSRRVSEDDKPISTKRLKWGAILQPNSSFSSRSITIRSASNGGEEDAQGEEELHTIPGIGHCPLSDGHVERPIPGQLYA